MDEIGDVAEFLHRLDASPGRVIVVESNHDIGLDRWVREGRYRGDGQNMRVGLTLDQEMLDHREAVARALDAGLPPPKFSLLRRAIELTVPKAIEAVEWAHDGASRLIDGIECGHHGFRGGNGAKGTVQGFARMGRRMTIGDKHSPEINEGVYVAGCMQLQQGYNRGPSSWAIAHVVQYADGHRTIVTMQDGAWRAERPRISVDAA
jgi:Arc/MetJ-type ribon-helix-helix transcriptional regulator